MDNSCYKTPVLSVFMTSLLGMGFLLRGAGLIASLERDDVLDSMGGVSPDARTCLYGPYLHTWKVPRIHIPSQSPKSISIIRFREMLFFLSSDQAHLSRIRPPSPPSSRQTPHRSFCSPTQTVFMQRSHLYFPYPSFSASASKPPATGPKLPNCRAAWFGCANMLRSTRDGPQRNSERPSRHSSPARTNMLTSDSSPCATLSVASDPRILRWKKQLIHPAAKIPQVPGQKQCLDHSPNQDNVKT